MRYWLARLLFQRALAGIYLVAFVVGELACGRLTDRAEILARLQALPQARSVEHQEALAFVEIHRLMGAGLGWVDVNLLASATLSAASLWSFDRNLMKANFRIIPRISF